MIEPKIVRTSDDYGQAVVRVELANRPGVFATLDADDFDRMVAEGIKPRWVLNEAYPGFFYVRCYQPNVAGGLGVVARHVLQAGKGRQVKYRSGDKLDLRKRNLVLAPARWAKGQSPAATSPAEQFDPEGDPELGPVRFYAPDSVVPTGKMASPEAACGLSFSLPADR